MNVHRLGMTRKEVAGMTARTRKNNRLSLVSKKNVNNFNYKY
jgi:hypothetical protein